MSPTPLNRVEAEYLLSRALTRVPGLTRDGLRLRREVPFLPSTHWYYEVGFFDAPDDRDWLLSVGVTFANPPYANDPATSGAMWRGCAQLLDEALLLRASLDPYRLDIRAGRAGTPPCPRCDGVKVIVVQHAHVSGRGKKRVTTLDPRPETCPTCRGTGLRAEAPFTDRAFDAFLEQLRIGDAP